MTWLKELLDGVNSTHSRVRMQDQIQGMINRIKFQRQEAVDEIGQNNSLVENYDEFLEALEAAHTSAICGDH